MAPRPRVVPILRASRRPGACDRPAPEIVAPAFHDAHAHPMDGGRQLAGCDLSLFPERGAP